jgi:predicted extracellular nuclease
MLWSAATSAQSVLPIGVIQGTGDVSTYNGQYVSFRGVVTGQYEDVNTRGIVYYTIFIQQLPEEVDGDPATSDAIAIFLGRRRPYVAIGDQVLVSGRVTEFYGFTEIDDDDLYIAVERRGVDLPSPVLIEPPPDIVEQTSYFEALESMRVMFPGPVVVAGPTHEGCGFAVMDEKWADTLPVIRRAAEDPVGRVVPVLNPSDLDCRDIPQVKTHDRIAELRGVLVYNFDQFKIILDSPSHLDIETGEMPELRPLPDQAPGQISVITLNTHDYFDTNRDTDETGEPVLSVEELGVRQAKLVYVLAHVLACPTVIALQEIENAALIGELVVEVAELCDFSYEVTHRESPDSRGIDNALLSDPRRVSVAAVTLRQTCSPVPTDVEDLSAMCEPGEEPLFGRPPLEVDALIDGDPYTFFVNHFKSKRGGEIETGLERIHQAVYLNGFAAERLAADPNARLIALGDFNDTELSPVLALLTSPAEGGQFYNSMDGVPETHRYTYNFGGVSELLDTILVSPALATEISAMTILHINTDFPTAWRLDTTLERLPFRFSDHDIPVLILGKASPEPTPTMQPSPQPSALPRPTVQPSITVRPSDTPSQPTSIPSPAAMIEEIPQDSGSGRAWPWIGLIACGLMLIALIWRRSR